MLRKIILGLGLFSSLLFASHLFAWTIYNPKSATTSVPLSEQRINTRALTVRDVECNAYPDKITFLKGMMDQKNGLYLNACELYNEWVDLASDKNCGLSDQKMDCAASKDQICSDMAAKYKPIMDWIYHAVELCDASAFIAACPSLAEQAAACKNMQCSDGCTYSYKDCSTQTFKSIMYGGQNVDKAYVEKCLKQQGIN